MEAQKDLYLKMANAAHSCRFIGVSINSRNTDEMTYRNEKERIESEWNLPVCDVFRENAGPLVKSVQAQIKY